MIHAATGISNGSDAYAVAVEAASLAQKNLTHDANIAFVFASVEYDQESVVKGVRSVLGDSVQIVGTSSAGEITEQGPAGRHSVAVMLLASENAAFYTGVGRGVADDPHKAGADMAEEIQKAAGDSTLKLIIMFPDVLAGNGSDIVRGVVSKVGEDIPIVGGASGDDFRFEKTYQHLNDTVYSGAVVGVGIAGDVQVGIGVRHGWLPIGIPMIVTRAEGSVLHELDGKPALSVYEDHFGPVIAEELKGNTLAKIAITYPLGMRAEGSEEMLVRDPLIANEDGSIRCVAEIPEGTEVRLMVGSREEAVRGASDAASDALEQLHSTKPTAVLVFDCVARKKLFSEHAPEEIYAIQKVIGVDIPLLGFYTYGELAPRASNTQSVSTFHNETVVIVALAD